MAIRLRTDGVRRLGSAALVLLLHLLLLLGLLRAVTAPRIQPRPTVREMILRFLPQRKSAPAQNAAPPAVASPQPRVRVMPIVPPPAGTASPPSLSGLGQSLFGCAPENLDSLSREQRTHCATGLAAPGDGDPPSLEKYPRRHAAKMGSAPVRIPCTYVTNAPGPYESVTPVPMASLDCLAGQIFGSKR